LPHPRPTLFPYTTLFRSPTLGGGRPEAPTLGSLGDLQGCRRRTPLPRPRAGDPQGLGRGAAAPGAPRRAGHHEVDAGPAQPALGGLHLLRGPVRPRGAVEGDAVPRGRAAPRAACGPRSAQRAARPRARAVVTAAAPAVG